MKEKIINLLVKIRYFFSTLTYRIKPRKNFRWILTFALWMLLFLYIVFGVYGGIEVYKVHSESKLTKFLVRIYPYPAAFVSGNIIWAKDYYDHLSYIRNYYSNINGIFNDTEIRQKVMDRLVENRIITWEAAKYGVKAKSSDVNDVYKKLVEEKGEAEVQKVIKGLFGISVGGFKQLIAEAVVEEKAQNELMAQVKVSHILVKDEARANEVANKLKSGEPLDQLAKTYSQDVKTRDSAGDLGWIARGNLKIDGKPVPEFEEAAFKAKVNEVFGPVKTVVGYQVGKVAEKKGQIQMSYVDWVNALKKRAKVFVFIK